MCRWKKSVWKGNLIFRLLSIPKGSRNCSFIEGKSLCQNLISITEFGGTGVTLNLSWSDSSKYSNNSDTEQTFDASRCLSLHNCTQRIVFHMVYFNCCKRAYTGYMRKMWFNGKDFKMDEKRKYWEVKRRSRQNKMTESARNLWLLYWKKLS